MDKKKARAAMSVCVCSQWQWEKEQNAIINPFTCFSTGNVLSNRQGSVFVVELMEIVPTAVIPQHIVKTIHNNYLEFNVAQRNGLTRICLFPTGEPILRISKKRCSNHADIRDVLKIFHSAVAA